MIDVDQPQLERHLARMRWATIATLVAIVMAAVAGFVLPRRSAALLSPLGTTLLAVAAALWLAFTVEGDARRRLDLVKRAYAATGEFGRLLRGHLGIYLVVLMRLALVAGAGVVIAVWGLGPVIALGTHLLAAALVALSWPTRHKTMLLVERAEAARAT